MRRALIVDDRADNRYLLRMFLEGHGFAVEEARTGVEALALAHAHPPAIVISDLLMPEMDGFTLLRQWKTDEAFGAIPFVVYTATYTEPADEQLALALGADAFIVKPLEPEPFMERVAAVLERAGRREVVAARPSVAEEAALRLYSEALVRKLEQRNWQLREVAAESARLMNRHERLMNLYAALAEVNRLVTRGVRPDELFWAVCRIAVERGGFALAWIGWLDTVTAEVAPVAWHGRSVEWLKRYEARLGTFRAHRPGRAPVEIALTERRVYLCNDLAADARLAPIHDLLAETGLRAAACFPLRPDTEPSGALTLFADERNYFDDALEVLGSELAADVSFAIAQAAREAAHRQTEEALRQSEKIAAMGALLAGVAHELNNPLAVVVGQAGLLQHAAAGGGDPWRRGRPRSPWPPSAARASSGAS